MAKWTSPLFTDIRNKLGNSVVFSMWKGRPYFRAYVVPANPKTNKQTAYRLLIAYLVARWKEIIDTDEKKAPWTAIALDFLISGFNVFVKFGQKTEIAASTGTGSKEIDIVYTAGFGAADAKVYGLEGANWEDVTPVDGLEAGADKEATLTMGKAETEYDIYIAHKDALKGADEHPQAYCAITCYKPNVTTGAIDKATAESAAA